MKFLKQLGRCFASVLLFVAAIGAVGTPERRALTVDELFTSELLPEIEITIPNDAVQALRDQPRQYVDAAIRLDGGASLDADLRLKGHGSFRGIDEKASFTVKLSGGALKIHLNNSVEDGSYIQEQLGSELFQAAGIPAPRVSHARVILNGRHLGLYVLKEGFTEAFLTRSFGSGSGELHEAEPPQLLSAASEPDPNIRWQKLSDLLDMSQFVTFLATEVLICHWDGYSTAANNFRVYHDSARGKFVFLPSGMDQLFGNSRFPCHPDMTGTVARALLETPQGRAAFQRRFRELASGFDGCKWAALAEKHGRVLEPNLSLSQVRSLRDSLEDLQKRIAARGEFLQKELNPIL